MIEAIQITTTVDSREAAARIAGTLVERRLAACVQVLGPVTSTYWWEGKVESAEEWLCLIKTRSDAYEAVEAAIRTDHPYDVPEILATPIIAGHSHYIDWLLREVSS